MGQYPVFSLFQFLFLIPQNSYLKILSAHSVEGRVPFLDQEMIQLGQLIPWEMKIAGSAQVEKWILRKAFEHLLPTEIIWRNKEQFDEGSGTVDVLNGLVAKTMSEDEALKYRLRFPETELRSSEETPLC